MTPDDIRSQRFATRLMRGLSPEEVTAFLEDVAEAYDNVQKTNTELTARVKTLQEEVRALSGRENGASTSSHTEVLRTAALREVEALLHDAQTQAQAVIDEAKAREAAILQEAEAVKARMHVEADELAAAAMAGADALVVAAREQEALIRGEIDRLTESRLKLVDDVRATLDTYHQWLATVDPRGRARGRLDTFDMTDGHPDGVGSIDEVRAG
jgi:DivIVA domain-containing protein